MHIRTFIAVATGFITLMPSLGISAAWKQYGETSTFKAFIDSESIKKRGSEGNTYDVWTQWELTKEGKAKMLPKKLQQKAKTLRMHWQVNCEEKTMLEMSNYLFDRQGNLLDKNDRVYQKYEMIPGTLTEDFVNQVCTVSEDKANDGIEAVIKDGVGKFQDIFKAEGLTGVSSYVSECYENAGATENTDLMVKCASADISGMLIDAGVAKNMGWPESMRNEFFMDATVKVRVKNNLSKVGINLDDNELKGFIENVSNHL